MNPLKRLYRKLFEPPCPDLRPDLEYEVEKIKAETQYKVDTNIRQLSQINARIKATHTYKVGVATGKIKPHGV